MRRSPEAFAEGLDQWALHTDSLEAEAARLNVAALFLLAGNYMTDGKFSK
jgi:hypothetical protein